MERFKKLIGRAKHLHNIHIMLNNINIVLHNIHTVLNNINILLHNIQGTKRFDAVARRNKDDYAPPRDGNVEMKLQLHAMTTCLHS